MKTYKQYTPILKIIDNPIRQAGIISIIVMYVHGKAPTPKRGKRAFSMELHWLYADTIILWYYDTIRSKEVYEWNIKSIYKKMLVKW